MQYPIMNYYELTCLMSPALSGQDAQETSQKIKDFIQKESGNLEKIILPIKKSLVHFVKKQEEAYLIIVNFRIEPEKIENLLKKLKLEDQIIRYMLLKKKPPTEKVKTESLRKQSGKSTKQYNNDISRMKNKKVELEEIDKKIEEILNND